MDRLNYTSISNQSRHTLLSTGGSRKATFFWNFHWRAKPLSKILLKELSHKNELNFFACLLYRSWRGRRLCFSTQLVIFCNNTKLIARSMLFLVMSIDWDRLTYTSPKGERITTSQELVVTLMYYSTSTHFPGNTWPICISVVSVLLEFGSILCRVEAL